MAKFENIERALEWAPPAKAEIKAWRFIVTDGNGTPHDRYMAQLKQPDFDEPVVSTTGRTLNAALNKLEEAIKETRESA